MATENEAKILLKLGILRGDVLPNTAVIDDNIKRLESTIAALQKELAAWKEKRASTKSILETKEYKRVPAKNALTWEEKQGFNPPTDITGKETKKRNSNV